MILNETTASHPFHQGDRRVPKTRPIPARTGLATGDCVSGMSIEDKCAWMKKRQELLRLQHRRNRRGGGQKPPFTLRKLHGRRG